MAVGIDKIHFQGWIWIVCTWVIYIFFFLTSRTSITYNENNKEGAMYQLTIDTNLSDHKKYIFQYWYNPNIQYLMLDDSSEYKSTSE